MCVQNNKNIVSEKSGYKKWKSGAVSNETKKLFEDRAKEFKKQNPTNEHRKRWNRRIRNDNKQKVYGYIH